MYRRKLIPVTLGPAALALTVAGLLAACSATTVASTQAATGRTTGASHRAALSGAPSARMCNTASKARTYRHVVVILEENYSYSSIYRSSSAPYINGVIGHCGLATNYHNITHYSLPNYIGMTDGATLGQLGPYLNDCEPSSSCRVNQPSIFGQLGSKGGWKSYAESMPSPCARSSSGFYDANHNPAIYYANLGSCAANDVPLGTTGNSPLLRSFSREATAPAFSFITPNLCDDMHGTDGCPSDLIRAGDQWLSRWLPRITSTGVYRSRDTAVFIVWDEGEPSSAGQNCAVNPNDQSCHVVAMVVAPSVRPGTRVRTFFNHYSLLKTEEDLLGVSELGLARTAASMARAFNL